MWWPSVQLFTGCCRCPGLALLGLCSAKRKGVCVTSAMTAVIPQFGRFPPSRSTFWLSDSCLVQFFSIPY